MNETDEDTIVRSLDFIAENTVGQSKLLNLLQEKQLISSVERQTIVSQDTDYEKNTLLYTTITKKGENSFQILLECLENSGNQTVAKKLKGVSTSNYSSNNEEFLWFDIKASTPFYKGRDGDIEKIHKSVLEAFRSKKLRFVGVTGLGGVGKSELARNYAEKFYEEIKGHCIWINADTSQTISDSFKRLANEVGLSVSDSSGKEKSLNNILLELYAKLCKQRCLFIFDDLEKYTEAALTFLVQHSTKQAPSKPKPFFLMTSRYQLVNAAFGYSAIHIQLNVLSEDSSIAFLKEALSISFTEEDRDVFQNIKILSEKLKCFPLAMQQAAAYINEKKRNSDVATEIQIYLDCFDQESKRLLDYPLPELQHLEDVSRTTYMTWQITLDKIEKLPGIKSKAANALNIISVLHSEDIDTRFVEIVLEAMFPSDINNIKKENVDIFEVLDVYSMCQKLRKGRKIVISVHRLVQEVIRIKLEEENKLTEFLDRFLQFLDSIMENDDISLNDMIHIESLWNHATKTQILLKKYSFFPGKMAKKYYDAGSYTDAYRFSSCTIETLSEAFGNKDRAVLKMMCWKGSVLERLGEYNTSLGILEDVYEKQKNLFGEDDDHALQTIGRIGLLHCRQGSYRKALRLLGDAFKISKEMYGTENKETLTLKHSTALVLTSQGKLEEALNLYEEVLQVQIRLNGDDDISTITTKRNIGSIKCRQGKYDDALKLYEEVLRVREHRLGIEHPDTMQIKDGIGNIKLSQGKYDDALNILENVFKVRERQLGQEHPSTVLTKRRIGVINLGQGKYKIAEEIFEEVLAVYHGKFKKDHPKTLIVMNNIGLAKCHQGNYEDALKILEDVLEKKQRVYGSTTHPEVLNTKHNIGLARSGQDNSQEALGIFEDVFAIRERILGEMHPSTLETKHELGHLKRHFGKTDDALKLFNDVLAKREVALGKSHPHTLKTKQEIDNLLLQLKSRVDSNSKV